PCLRAMAIAPGSIDVFCGAGAAFFNQCFVVLANKWSRRMLKKIVSIIGLSLGMFGGSHADGYPDRPLTVIVPFSVGGNVDIVARLVNQKLDAEIGQPVITQNMPGASGIIGT